MWAFRLLSEGADDGCRDSEDDGGPSPRAGVDVNAVLRGVHSANEGVDGVHHVCADAHAQQRHVRGHDRGPR